MFQSNDADLAGLGANVDLEARSRFMQWVTGAGKGTETTVERESKPKWLEYPDSKTSRTLDISNRCYRPNECLQ